MAAHGVWSHTMRVKSLSLDVVFNFLTVALLVRCTGTWFNYSTEGAILNDLPKTFLMSTANLPPVPRSWIRTGKFWPPHLYEKRVQCRRIGDARKLPWREQEAGDPHSIQRTQVRCVYRYTIRTSQFSWRTVCLHTSATAAVHRESGSAASHTVRV